MVAQRADQSAWRYQGVRDRRRNNRETDPGGLYDPQLQLDYRSLNSEAFPNPRS